MLDVADVGRRHEREMTGHRRRCSMAQRLAKRADEASIRRLCQTANLDDNAGKPSPRFSCHGPHSPQSCTVKPGSNNLSSLAARTCGVPNPASTSDSQPSAARPPVWPVQRGDASARVPQRNLPRRLVFEVVGLGRESTERPSSGHSSRIGA